MEKKKNITLLVIGLLAVVAFSFGISYAYFVSRITKEGEGSNVGGSTATKQDTVVSTTGSIGFTDTNIYPGHKNISKIVVTATGDSHVIYNLVWNGTNTLNTTINYKVYKATTEKNPSIKCAKHEEGTIRKELYEECTENLTGLGEVISEGMIESTEASTKVKLIRNEEIDASNVGAKVYYYIVLEYPNKEDSQNIDMNGSFTGNINVELLEEKEYCTNDTCKYLIAKNEMVHETFTKEDGTVVDTGYRYEGANPNNYVRFNNELWRIIGVFETVNADTNETESLVKLIRNESIGNIRWDTYGYYGSNDWTESDIKTILNGQYLNGEDINYNYRNPNHGDGNINPTVSIAGVSIKDTAREMIENAKWNIGGASSSSSIVSAFYIEERGTTGAKSNPTIATWNGYIGLMYPSDYGYAVDSTSCPRTASLWKYSYTGSCKTNNWLLNNNNQWMLTPSADGESSQYYVSYDYNINSLYPGLENSIRPTIYLKSNVQIVDGDGSQEHPYELTI